MENKCATTAKEIFEDLFDAICEGRDDEYLLVITPSEKDWLKIHLKAFHKSIFAMALRGKFTLSAIIIMEGIYRKMKKRIRTASMYIPVEE